MFESCRALLSMRSLRSRQQLWSAVGGCLPAVGLCVLVPAFKLYAPYPFPAGILVEAWQFRPMSFAIDLCLEQGSPLEISESEHREKDGRPRHFCLIFEFLWHVQTG